MSTSIWSACMPSGWNLEWLLKIERVSHPARFHKVICFFIAGYILV